LTAFQIPSATKSERQTADVRWRFDRNKATMDETEVPGLERRVMVKDIVVALAIVLTITSVAERDWSNIIRRPQMWKPSPSIHNAGQTRSEPRTKFTYRPKVIAAVRSFKASAAHLFHRADNRRAAAPFDRDLTEKPRPRKATVDSLRYRNNVPASTQVRPGGNHRWHELARTVWAKLGIK